LTSPSPPIPAGHLSSNKGFLWFTSRTLDFYVENSEIEPHVF
jgi:hypothetical protein